MTVFQEVVKAVNRDYPKFSPACLSLSMRTYETGVQMTPRAKKIAESVQGAETLCKRFSENRVKSISFRCRLSHTDAEIVKHKMMLEERDSVQDLLEELLMEWAKKPLPGGSDRETAGRKVGPFPLRITQKTKEVKNEQNQAGSFPSPAASMAL